MAAAGIPDELECCRLFVTGIPSILVCDLAGIALHHQTEQGWDLVVRQRGKELPGAVVGTMIEELPQIARQVTERGSHVLDSGSGTAPAVFLEQGIESIAVLPIGTARGPLGLLLVGRAASSQGNDLEDPILFSLAAQLGLGIQNVRHQRSLENTVAERTEELRRRASDLQEAHEETRQLLELTNAIVGPTDRSELFDAISSALSSFVDCDRSALLVYREETDSLEVYALSGPLADQLPAVGTLVPRGAMRAPWRPIEELRPIITDDLSAQASTDLDRKLADQGVRGHLAVPLRVKDQVLGVLAVASRRAGVYAQADAERLSRVATQVGLAVEKMLAFEEISRLKSQLEQENLYLRQEIKTEHGFDDIVGGAPALLEALRAVETVASTDATVLLTGETGTGKEIIARALHSRSGRAERALVKVNCAAIPEGLVESELFGHERGAFTGALTRKIGRFELADGGTIFLDEIGELPLELQSKLLRVLQEGEFERLGSAATRTVDVRVIAATNRDLNKAIADGRFRSDLFYRLNVFPIHVPPLRARREDIRPLVAYFADRFSRKLERGITGVPRSTMDRLTAYDWPGNVRELRNVVERAVILSRGDALELGPWFQDAVSEAPGSDSLDLDEVQRSHILKVLDLTNWKVSGAGGASELLGLKPSTLNHRLKKLGIQRPTGTKAARSTPD